MPKAKGKSKSPDKKTPKSPKSPGSPKKDKKADKAKKGKKGKKPKEAPEEASEVEGRHIFFKWNSFDVYEIDKSLARMGYECLWSTERFHSPTHNTK